MTLPPQFASLSPMERQMLLMNASQGLDIPADQMEASLGEVDGVQYRLMSDGRIIGLDPYEQGYGARQQIYAPDGSLIEDAELKNFGRRNPISDLAMLGAMGVAGANIAAAGVMGGGGFLSGGAPVGGSAPLATGTIAPLPVGAELAAMAPSVNMGALAGGSAGGALAAGEIASLPTGSMLNASIPAVGSTSTPLLSNAAIGATALPTGAALTSALPAIGSAASSIGAGSALNTLGQGLALAGAATGGAGIGGGSAVDPSLRQAIQDNLNRANTAADNLAPRQVASLTPEQTQAQQNIAGLAASNPGLTAAQTALNTLGSFNASAPAVQAAQAVAPTLPPAAQATVARLAPAAMVQATSAGPASLISRSDIRNVAPRGFLDANLDRYLNPYTGAVVDQAAQDNERARQLAQQQINAQAVGRGAFGGSRQAVLESENTRNFMDAQARTASALRAQGFDTAANLIMQDANRSLQADQINQGMDFSVAGANTGARNQMAQFDAGLRQNANLANQAAQNGFALADFQAANNMAQFNTAAQNQFALNQFGVQADNSRFNAGQANAVGLQNAGNNLQAQGMNLNAAGGFLSGGLNMNNAMLGNAGRTFEIFDVNRQLTQQQNDANRQNVIDQQQLRNSALGLASPAAFTAPRAPNAFGQALGLGALGLGAYEAFPNAFKRAGSWLSNLGGD